LDTRAEIEDLYRDVTRVVHLSDEELVLLPRDKIDEERVKILEGLPVKQLIPLVRHLMVWMQDVNWPIFHQIHRLLLRLDTSILLEPIREVLTTTDDIWKTYVILGLVEARRADLAPALRAELERIVRDPTPGEIAEHTDKAAADMLTDLC
jgi:hypothetical protein